MAERLVFRAEARRVARRISAGGREIPAFLDRCVFGIACLGMAQQLTTVAKSSRENFR